MLTDYISSFTNTLETKVSVDILRLAGPTAAWIAYVLLVTFK